MKDEQVKLENDTLKKFRERFRGKTTWDVINVAAARMEAGEKADPGQWTRFLESMVSTAITHALCNIDPMSDDNVQNYFASVGRDLAFLIQFGTADEFDAERKRRIEKK